MRQVLNIFFRAEGSRPFLVLACLLVGGTLEAIGVGTLLPALSTMLRGNNAQPSGFETFVKHVADWAGLTPDLKTLLAVAVTFLIIRALLLFGAMTYAGITGARVANALRRRLIKAVFDARWSYYADQSSGRVASAISTDASYAGDAYNLCAIAVTNAVQIAAYTLVALFINWRVALAALAGGLVIAAASSRLLGVARTAGQKQFGRTATLTADMVDLVQNLKPLKAMHRYDPMIESLSQIVKKLRRSLYTLNVARFGMIYGNDVMMVLILAGASYVAVVHAGVPAEQLIVIGILFFQVMSYMSKFLKQLQFASAIEAAYLRTQDMIAEAERQKEERRGSAAPPSRADAVFENVSFSHGESQVLNNVSAKIRAGRITVLQGPSGAGKTTLIDLLIGLHRPTSGHIRIGKTPLADIDLVQWRRRIGYVPQELTLFHDTIRENIALSEPGISDDAIRAALSQAGADEFLDSLPHGLDTDVGEFGGKLSGGQRQRISLARALVRQPEILILDEVTSALDPETESAIVKNTARLRGEYTIIAITHRPAWAQIADTLYVFKEGSVTEAKPRKPRK